MTPAAVPWQHWWHGNRMKMAWDTPEARHARDCAYVTTDGPAPCTCGEPVRPRPASPRVQVWRDLPLGPAAPHTWAFYYFLKRCGDQVKILRRTATSLDIEVTSSSRFV